MPKKNTSSGGGVLGKPTPLFSDIIRFARAARKYGCRSSQRETIISAARAALKAHERFNKRNALSESQAKQRQRSINAANRQVNAAERCTPEQKRRTEDAYVRVRMKAYRSMRELSPAEKAYGMPKPKKAKAKDGRSTSQGSESTAHTTNTPSEPSPVVAAAAATVHAATKRAVVDMDRAAARVAEAEEAAAKVVEAANAVPRTRRAPKKIKKPQLTTFTLQHFPGVTFESGDEVELRGRIERVNRTSGSINVLDPRPATAPALEAPKKPAGPKVLPVMECCDAPGFQFPKGTDLVVRGRITRVNQNGTVTIEEPKLLKKGEVTTSGVTKPKRAKKTAQPSEPVEPKTVTRVDPQTGRRDIIDAVNDNPPKVEPPIRVGNVFITPGTIQNVRGRVLRKDKDGNVVIEPRVGSAAPQTP